MFEYIVSGFTGTFFSYFCVYMFGVYTNIWSNHRNDRVKLLQINLSYVEDKLEKIHHDINYFIVHRNIIKP